MLSIGEEKRFQLSNAFFRLFQNADQKVTESWKKLQTLKQETKMTDDELKEQAVLMRQFYETPAKSFSTTPYYDDEIYEILLAREVLIDYVENLLYRNAQPVPNAWRKIREWVAGKTSGRIDVKSTPSSLDIRLQELLHLADQSIEQWIKDGKYTDHFHQCEVNYQFRQLKICKYEIWKLWMHRELELGTLHGSSTVGIDLYNCILITGHAKSGNLLRGVKGRSKWIYKLIDKYNSIIRKLPSDKPRPNLY